MSFVVSSDTDSQTEGSKKMENTQTTGYWTDEATRQAAHVERIRSLLVVSENAPKTASITQAGPEITFDVGDGYEVAFGTINGTWGWGLLDADYNCSRSGDSEFDPLNRNALAIAAWIVETVRSSREFIEWKRDNAQMIATLTR